MSVSNFVHMNPGLKKPYAYEGLERGTEMGPSPLWFENELYLLLSYSCFAEGLNTSHSGNTQILRVCARAHAWLLYNYIISCYENCTQDS